MTKTSIVKQAIKVAAALPKGAKKVKISSSISAKKDVTIVKKTAAKAATTLPKIAKGKSIVKQTAKGAKTLPKSTPKSKPKKTSRITPKFLSVVPPMAELVELKKRLEIEQPDRCFRITYCGVQRQHGNRWHTVCSHGIMKARCKRCCPQERLCIHEKIRSDCPKCGVTGCTHKANKSYCRECNGSGLCGPHKKPKHLCLPCGGVSRCPCGNIKWLCLKCEGSQMCLEHKILKRYCKPCGGQSICEHNIRVYGCRECGSNLFCQHGRLERRCLECDGADLCPHTPGKLKYNCRDCGGSAFCKAHNKYKTQCVECGGSSLCPHGRARYVCRDCKGAGICEHDRIRWYCVQCGGKSLCSTKGCNKRRQKDGFCTTCHPDFVPSMQGSSKIACLCIDLTERELQISLQHVHYCKMSKTVVGSEFRPPEVPKFPVDGYEENSKTVYEFLGDEFHGHPSLYSDPTAKNHKGKPYGKLFANTQKKFTELASHGYTVYYIWECDFVHHVKHCALQSLWSKWRKFDGSLKF